MEENKKISIFDKISLCFRKKWLTNRTITFFVSFLLITAFIILNLWVKTLNLPDIDVTENKIYTLSDASKEAVSKVTEDIKIYAYGFGEDSSLINFLKQYNKANEKITYEILTEETNPEKIKENELSEGYTVLILESGDSRKVIDAQNEFYTYDYTTYQQIDTTEQTITNSILSLNVENKPKIYFMQGHKEFTSEEIASLKVFLTNEAYESKEVNLINEGKVPEDCDALVILSPESDLLDIEVPMIEEYINKGGNIIFTQDMLSGEVAFTNLQKILDLYGVSVQNGYIVEADSNYAVYNYPYIIMPNVSQDSDITSEIYTDSRNKLILVYASRLNTKSDTELENLKVSKQELLFSSDNAYFIKDISSNIEEALKNAEVGKSVISYMMTKNVSAEEDNKIDSKLLICATGSFISDYPINIDGQKPLSYLASNRDFILNGIADLTKREGTLKIRKDMSNSTYIPTVVEHYVVLSIIILIPILIIFIGIMIWKIRKKRK